MIGLCYFCLSSGIEVSVIKGKTICDNCILGNAKLTPMIKENIPHFSLPFEDLPRANNEELVKLSNKFAEESFERINKRKSENNV